MYAKEKISFIIISNSGFRISVVAPLNIYSTCPGLIKLFYFLKSKRQITLGTIAPVIPGIRIQGIAAVGVKCSPRYKIPVGTYDLVIAQVFQRDTKLVICGKAWCKQPGVPPLRERKYPER